MSDPNPFDLPDVPPAETIRKTINRVFDYPGRQLPIEISGSFSRLQALNPEYEHKVYDGPEMEAYVRRHYPGRVYRAYSRIRPTYKAARTDLFRYLLMYREGGIYLDVKSTAKVPFREIIKPNDVCILSHWDNGPGGEYETFGLHPELKNTSSGEFQNWFLMCARGHPFMRATIERVVANVESYQPWVQGVSSAGTLRVTGPIAMTLAIEPLLSQSPSRIVENERRLGLVYTVYDHFLDHTKLTPHHYHWRRDSLVSPEGFQVASFAVFQLWNKLLNSPKSAPTLARLGFRANPRLVRI